MIVFLRVVFLVLCFSGATDAADQSSVPSFQRWFSFTLDNDIFVGTDGGYTNGFYFSWYDIPVGKNSSQPDIPWYYHLQSYLTGGDDGVNAIRSHNVGQTMVTPSDILLLPPDEEDLPYAGLLFWQGSILKIRDRRTDFSTLYLGVVGPASLAEQSQKLVHSVTDSDEPLGWDYQLHNEPLIALGYGRLWQNFESNPNGIGFDVVTGTQGTIGNLTTGLSASTYLRLGTQLESSYSILALASEREINPISHSDGWFVYVGAQLEYSLNNIVFDGNTFRDSPSIDWEKGSAILTAGMSVSGKYWGLSISYTEFGGADSDDEEKQKFGSFSILHRLR